MKKVLVSFSRGVLFILCIGLFLAATTGKWAVASMKEAVDFDTLLEQPPEIGMHVKGDVMFAYDCIASEESYTQRSDGSRSRGKKTYEYYLLPAEGEFPFIVLKSFAEDSKRMEAIADETWNYMYGESEPTTRVSVEGVISALDPELEEYLNEYLVEVWEYSEEELANAEILMIEQPASMSQMRGMFFAGIACILLAVVWFVINLIRNSKSEKAE